MKRLFLLLLAVNCLLVACAGQGELDAAALNGAFLTEPIAVSDIKLMSTSGTELSLADLQGKIVLLYFGYTFCPDVCPTTLAELNRVQNELDEVGEKIQVIMVTVDPERDTPHKLAEYVSYFNPNFIGLTGGLQEIDQLGKDFGLYYEHQDGTAATGYLVDHTARVFVVNQDGEYQLSFRYGTPAADITSDLRLMLNTN